MFDFIKNINNVKRDGLSKSVDSFFPNFSTNEAGVIALDVSNANLIPTTAVIFNSDANIYAANFGNPAGIAVFPRRGAIFNVDYVEVLSDNRVNPYIIRSIKLVSTSFNQFSRQIRLVKKTASGILCLQTFTPLEYFNVEQEQQLQVRMNDLNIELDGSMGFEIDMDAADPAPPNAASSYQVYINTDKLDVKKSLYGIKGIDKLKLNRVYYDKPKPEIFTV